MILLNLILIWLAYTLIMSNLNVKNWHKQKTLSCGLIGYSGPEPFDKDKLKILYYISALERGTDSTGFYSEKNGLLKSTDAGYDVAVSDEVWDKIIPDKLFIGHVRAKTHGAATQENAHPFKRGSVILAHNGTLNNFTDLKFKYDLTSNVPYEVDSDVLCGCIAKAGNLKPLGEINGAAALLIHSTLKQYSDTMYIFRKSSTIEAQRRPLFRGNIGPNVYICSISEALKLIGCINIKEFDEDYLYTIKSGLIVGDPLKITNQPYSKPFISNTTSHSNNSSINVEAKKRELQGQVVRLKGVKYTCYPGGGAEPFDINDTIELLITKCKSNFTFDYEVLKNSYKSQGAFVNVDENSIIKQHDILRAIEDVYDKDKKLVLKKDDMVKCTFMYMDHDLSITGWVISEFPNIGAYFSTKMLLKKYFRKVTDINNLNYYNLNKESLSNIKTNPVYIENRKCTVEVIVEKDAVQNNIDNLVSNLVNSKPNEKLVSVVPVNRIIGFKPPFKLTEDDLTEAQKGQTMDIVTANPNERHPLDEDEENNEFSKDLKPEEHMLMPTDVQLTQKLFSFLNKTTVKIEDIKASMINHENEKAIRALIDLDKSLDILYSEIFAKKQNLTY